MKTIVLLKHIEKKIIIAMYFKNGNQAVNWWCNFPSSDEWIPFYEDERKRSGHRYELEYSKFDEQGKMYSKYIICYSKKEALSLKRTINFENPNYTITIKKIY
jgi:hypothetical protein